ncbi:MAG: type VI secretion system contractile sheath large subunit [Pseudomonadota bacterium]
MPREGSVGPRERVNIVYRSVVGGVEQDIELPFKILVLGDFSRRGDDVPVEDLRPARVEKNNFDQVLEKCNPVLNIRVKNHFGGDPEDRLPLKINIRRLGDFEPDALVSSIPELRLALDRKKGVLGLRPALETAPAPRSLLALLLQTDAPPEKIDRRFIDVLAADLDWKLGRQLDEILHHPDFQGLERAWRGLKFLVDRVDFRENIILEILDLPKNKLLEDFADSLNILQSGFHKLVYTAEYGQFGGSPHAVIVADYFFDHSPRDIKLLQDMAAVGAMSHAPVIANASPEFFGSADFSDLPNLKDPAGHFASRQFARWQSLRESEDSRYLGLTLPRFLLRKPYSAEDTTTSGYYHEEDVRGRRESHLWGGAALALASRLADSFARYRWRPNIIGPKGGGLVEGLIFPDFESLPGIEHKIPTEVFISERLEFDLAQEGFIALTLRNGSDQACFFSANSVQRPKKFGPGKEAAAAEFNYRLGTQLQYLMLINRLAHYLKVMQRERVGAWRERADLEEELNRWLRQYVSDMDDPSPGVKSRRPLRQARVTVEDGEHPGWYKARILARPHLKYMGLHFTLALDGKMEKQ